MPAAESCVTIHMAASLDGFVARKDGRVDWMATDDEFPDGDPLDPATIAAFLETIDCYVMGAETYRTALRFESQGAGWSYDDKPVFVLTHRELPRPRDTVTFHAGDPAAFIDGDLRRRFRSIWVVGGPSLCTECLRLGIADEVRYSILPVLVGDGIGFFGRFGQDIGLHLMEAKAYRNGMVDLRYQVRGRPRGSIGAADTRA